MYSTTNTVPVYRHGRKFYVSLEEYERIRTEERRLRRAQMQKSQNLPIPKSNHFSSRSSSTSFYNPVQRVTTQPQEYQYGVLRNPHLPTNQIHSRPSRSATRYYDQRDDTSSRSIVPSVKLPTTAIRSNSSDKVLDLRRTPQNTSLSPKDNISDDYSVKRSSSADIIQRQNPSSTYDYDQSPITLYPPSSTIEERYSPANASKLTNYINRIPPSTLDTSTKPAPSISTFDTDSPDVEHVYTVHNFHHRRQPTDSRQSPLNHSDSEYYPHESNTGSYSGDGPSTTGTFLPRRKPENNRYQRTDLVVETDDDYEQQNQIWAKSNVRNQPTDGLTEKKRVRFADMEGLALELAPEDDQRRVPTDDPPFIRRAQVDSSNDLRRYIQPFHNSFYPTNPRFAGNSESKLATDV